MTRLPSIDPRNLRDHADDERVDRIWKRVRDDLPIARSAAAPRSLHNFARRRHDAGEPRRGARSVLLFAAAAALFAAGLAIGKSGSTSGPASVAEPTTDVTLTDVFAAGSKQRTFAIPGGGRVVLEPDSMMEVVELSDSQVTLSLLRGAASVDAGIGLDVVAGEARVTAPAGSSLSFTRRESDIDVLVEQGSAEVSWPAGRSSVSGGHVLNGVPTVATLSFVDGNDQPTRVTPPPPTLALVPPDHVRRTPPVSREDTPVAPLAVETAQASPTLVVVEPPPPSWLAYFQSNKEKEALELIEKAGGLEATIKTATSARELMLLWEIASRAKKSDLATRAVRRVADEFGSDPNAPAAALILATTYESTDPALAAKYREKAAQTKALAELALCDEVRAAISAGDRADPQAAMQTASKYLKDYPKGSCADDAKTLLEESAARPPVDPAEKERLEKADKDKADKEKADKEKADKERAEKEKAPPSAPAQPPKAAPSASAKPVAPPAASGSSAPSSPAKKP